jgi:hypothetical protein
METFKNLKLETLEFFRLHWPADKEFPKDWADPIAFPLRPPLENNQHQGCYVLLSGDVIRYIGVGLSRGSERYKNHGIGNRITHVIQIDKAASQLLGSRVYKTRERWNGITHISTIAFPEMSYMAAALEIFLISKLNPDLTFNLNRPGATSIDIKKKHLKT